VRSAFSQLRKERREMTARKKTTTGKGPARKLKLKKETIKDLGVNKRSGAVKGGRAIGTETCYMISCFQACCGKTGTCRLTTNC
jgi:hypothetical protein